MTDPPLPADLSGWPADPCRLLGVGPGASARDVRAAYTRLIRFYKPEHYPREFERLRAAYEALVAGAPLPPPRPAPPARPAADPSPAPNPARRAPHPVRRALRPPEPEPERERVSGMAVGRPIAVDREVAALWETAAREGADSAYGPLARIAEHYPRHAGLYARLYWLRRADSRVDPNRWPVDWLFAGLARTRLDRTLVELLAAEVRRDPGVACRPDCRQLLESDADPAALAAFLAVRWEGLLRTCDWAAVAEEMRQTRDRVLAGGEGEWLALMGRVWDWVAWEARGADQLRRLCARQIEALEHLAVREPYWFDRADALRATVRACIGFWDEGKDATLFCRVVRDGSRQPFAEVHDSVEGLIARIAAEPRKWLNTLSGRSGPPYPALAHFGTLLDRYAADGHPLLLPADLIAHGGRALRRMINDLGRAPGWARMFGGCTNYRAVRGQLLDLCLREDIGAEIVADHLPARPVAGCRWADALAEAVQKDWPLRYVVCACRLFRA